jgi:phosphatidylserine decarboxylase
MAGERDAVEWLDEPENVPEVSPEVPPALWRAMLAGLGRLPQAGMSRAFGSLADLPLPRPLRRPVLGGFARAVGIDLAEAAQPLTSFRSLNEFFVRRLKDGLRSWPAEPHVAGSPVDGVAGRAGAIRAGQLLQAKGRRYSAAQLLDDGAEAARFTGGAFLTLYLSPRHYHRIHSPAGGTIAKARYVPGALLPVNAPAVAHVQDLFARNERLVCYQDGPLGRIAIVAIGAYNVGRISAAFDDDWGGTADAPAAGGRRRSATNRRGAAAETRLYTPAVEIARGEEIMAFHLGSTVVLLFEKGVGLISRTPGSDVRLGEPIARA